MSTKNYNLSREGIRQEKSKALMRVLFTALFGIAVGLGIPMVAGLIEPWLAIIIISISLLAFGLGMRRGYKILQERWSSFQIIISPEFIIRKQSTIPDIEIDREQVSKIQENLSGIFVRTAGKQKHIHVPRSLEGYQEVRSELQQWHTIEQPSTKKAYVSILLLLLFAASFAAMFLSSRAWLVISAGIFIISYTIWGQISFHRDTQIDARVKLNTWRIVLLVLLMLGIVAGRIYVVLSR